MGGAGLPGWGDKKMYRMRHAARGARHAPCGMRHAACSMRHVGHKDNVRGSRERRLAPAKMHTTEHLKSGSGVRTVAWGASGIIHVQAFMNCL